MRYNMKNLANKKRFIIAFYVVLSALSTSFLQNQIIKVNADVEPIVVDVQEIDFGTVFPGEKITNKEFLISLTEGESNDIKYKIIKERTDERGNKCEENAPESCLPDLCPYITPILIDDEGDTVSDSYLKPNTDTSDRWKISFEVPAIKGFIAQSFIGTPAGENGLHGCRLSVDIGDEDSINNKSSISGHKFNDKNGNAILDEGEEGVSNWQIQLVKCPYTPLKDNESIYLSKSTINSNPESGNTGYCTILKTTITDSEGYYTFGDLDSGDYGINEEDKEEWKQTYPLENQYYYLNLGIEENVTNINFLNSNISEEPGCGNGILEKNEICDDGNLVNGDGCETNCTLTSNQSSGNGGGSSIVTLKIREEKVSEITQTSADFTWLTNLKANSRVACSENETWEDISGEKPNYGYGSSTIVYDSDPNVTSHKVSVEGLKPGTKYSCRVISAKNGKEVKSSEIDFQTAKEENLEKETDLFIFDLLTGNITTTSFESSWKTNKEASTCAVYGESSILLIGHEPNFGYSSRTSGCDQLDNKSINHNQAFTELKPCTTYYYRAIAYAEDQKAISNEQKIITACIAGIRTENMAPASPQISDNPASTESQEESGEVKEAEDEKFPVCNSGNIGDIIQGNCINGCMLWLLILIIVLLLLYIWKKKEDEKRARRNIG